MPSILIVGAYKTKNTVMMEYHIPFYAVNQRPTTREEALQDPALFRQAAVFGPTSDRWGSSRWIYEEQLSFLIIGMGNDAYTCYQLSEHHPDTQGGGSVANEDGFLSPNRFVDPTAVLLNWLTLAMEHVVQRWSRAMDAVNNEIDTATTIVFSDENPDLLADDAQFSKSRTYFWSLQVYKVFEERLVLAVKSSQLELEARRGNRWQRHFKAILYGVLSPIRATVLTVMIPLVMLEYIWLLPISMITSRSPGDDASTNWPRRNRTTQILRRPATWLGLVFEAPRVPAEATSAPTIAFARAYNPRPDTSKRLVASLARNRRRYRTAAGLADRSDQRTAFSNVRRAGKTPDMG